MNMLMAKPLDGSQFITITLPPSAYKFKAQEQHTKIKDIIFITMNTHCLNFCMVAELTKQANVHYHGWFTERYANATTFLLDHLKQRYLGFTQVNKERIHHVDRTGNYMMKDIELTKRLINRPIVSNYFAVPRPPPELKKTPYKTLEI